MNYHLKYPYYLKYSDNAIDFSATLYDGKFSYLKFLVRERQENPRSKITWLIIFKADGR